MMQLAQLNHLSDSEFTAQLGALYEHSPWVAAHVVDQRPFANLAALHAALEDAVHTASQDLQLALICAHPELAGKAAVSGQLTAASTTEQRHAGLAHCTTQQFQQIRELNALYVERFRFPFILAVKGHNPDTVIAQMQARVGNAVDQERTVALQQICRIGWFRLADLVAEPIADQIQTQCAELAQYSDLPEGLACSYLTPAHQATALRIRDYMLAAGLTVDIDAVGNVTGTWHSEAESAKTLLTGSHYDTVINGGRYDGRLGILLPVAVVSRLRRQGHRLPYHLQIVAFSEEEGVRFRSTFLGSRALTGDFPMAVLDSVDAQGISLRDAIIAAGHDPQGIDRIARDPDQLLGFIEVHIEQGPVLLTEDRPVGVVSSIAGSVRSQLSVTGLAGHAGTVPMHLRQDAAAGVAEMVLAVEQICSGQSGLVGTVGQLLVPGGAMNVIPGRCEFSLDIRSGDDAVRDSTYERVMASLQEIATRRRLALTHRKVVETSAVACDVRLSQLLAGSIAQITSHAARTLPSGAGHDAMMMARITPMTMLFVRCGNGGISHHPDESLAVDDIDTAAQVFSQFLDRLACQT